MYNYTKPEGKMILICYVDHIMYVCMYIYMGNIMYIIYIYNITHIYIIQYIYILFQIIPTANYDSRMLWRYNTILTYGVTTVVKNPPLSSNMVFWKIPR